MTELQLNYWSHRKVYHLWSTVCKLNTLAICIIGMLCANLTLYPVGGTMGKLMRCPKLYRFVL